MTKGPTMKDAIESGNGTLHGAIDYWQKRALDAEAELEAFQSADETTRKLADNYMALTCQTKDRDWETGPLIL